MRSSNDGDLAFLKTGENSVIGAVDIGGTKLAVGIVDEDGSVLSKRESPSGANLDYSKSLERIAGMLREAGRDAGAEITGIGIGSTGPVDPFSGEFGDLDFLPRWRGKNLVKDLALMFGVRVALENDADAGALAESSWGAGRNKSRLVYVTVGTGIRQDVHPGRKRDSHLCIGGSSGFPNAPIINAAFSPTIAQDTTFGVVTGIDRPLYATIIQALFKDKSMHHLGIVCGFAAFLIE